MLRVSAVPSAHCPQLLCGSWLFLTVHRSLFQRWRWERGHSPAAQLQIVQSLEPHLWLELFTPTKALYLGWPISSGTVPMQGPGLTVVFWTAGFVSCGLSRGCVCVTPWLSYSPTIQFELSTFGLQGVSGYISSSLVLCLLCIFL